MTTDWQKYHKLEEKAFLLTLKSVCKALQEQGIVSVEMSYEGSGDSGDYDYPVFTNEDSEDVSPDGGVERFRATRKWDQEKGRWVNTEISKTSATLEDVAADLMGEAVTMRHSGWENNGGGKGTVTLDVPLGALTVSHGSYYTSTDWDNYSFAVDGGEE